MRCRDGSGRHIEHLEYGSQCSVFVLNMLRNPTNIISFDRNKVLNTRRDNRLGRKWSPNKTSIERGEKNLGAKRPLIGNTRVQRENHRFGIFAGDVKRSDGACKIKLLELTSALILDRTLREQRIDNTGNGFAT